MRTTILVESTVSGVVIGVVLGVVALSIATVVAGVLPAGAARWIERLRTPAIVVCLVVLPLIGAVLGYLEGRLKLR